MAPAPLEGGEGPAEEPGSEETTTEPAKPATVPNFKQKFTHEDGVAIEVIKIEKGQADRRSRPRRSTTRRSSPGRASHVFTIKITNDSKESVAYRS